HVSSPCRTTVTVTYINVCLAMVRPPPTPPVFPYTTLFRSPGTGTFTVYVQGRNLPGATTLTVQATGYTNGTAAVAVQPAAFVFADRNSTRLNSSHVATPYAVSGVLDPDSFVPAICGQSVRR